MSGGLDGWGSDRPGPVPLLTALALVRAVRAVAHKVTHGFARGAALAGDPGLTRAPCCRESALWAAPQKAPCRAGLRADRGRQGVPEAGSPSRLTQEQHQDREEGARPRHAEAQGEAEWQSAQDLGQLSATGQGRGDTG